MKILSSFPYLYAQSPREVGVMAIGAKNGIGETVSKSSASVFTYSFRETSKTSL